MTPSGPADRAGLKPGDVIVAVNGKPIKSGNELVNDIVDRKPGSTVKIDYLRDGKRENASVAVDDRAKLYANRLGDQGEGNEGNDNEPTPSKLGVTVRSVTPEIADQMRITAGRGVLVQGVKPGSFADDIGLDRGMVILQINKQNVNSEADFNRVVSGLKSGEAVAMLVRQRGPNAPTAILGGTLP